MTDTIPNVPRELLCELRDAANEGMNATTRQHQIDYFAGLIAKADALLSAPSPANHVEDVRAMVDAPSPAGVDGLSVVAWQHWGDQTKLLCAIGKERGIPGGYTDEFTQPLCRLSDAQAIIDGLRGEVAKINSDRLACWAEFKVMTRACLDAEKERDQQAQRIGELEGLLREVAASLAWNAHGECRAIHDGPIMPSQMALDAAKASLSAGKEGE